MSVALNIRGTYCLYIEYIFRQLKMKLYDHRQVVSFQTLKRQALEKRRTLTRSRNGPSFFVLFENMSSKGRFKVYDLGSFACCHMQS